MLDRPPTLRGSVTHEEYQGHYVRGHLLCGDAAFDCLEILGDIPGLQPRLLQGLLYVGWEFDCGSLFGGLRELIAHGPLEQAHLTFPGIMGIPPPCHSNAKSLMLLDPHVYGPLLHPKDPPQHQRGGPCLPAYTLCQVYKLRLVDPRPSLLLTGGSAGINRIWIERSGHSVACYFQVISYPTQFLF